MYNYSMDNYKKALEIIESINENTSKEEIYVIANKAYNISNRCEKAIIILSRLEDNFFRKERILVDGINNAKDQYEIKYELAILYYRSGMYKKSLAYFEEIYSDRKELNVLYFLMHIYCLFEDDKINDLYRDCIKNIEDTSFVRLSFTYLIYLYKQCRFEEVKGLLRKINKLNPYILKVLCKEEINETTKIVKEAYTVVKNNSYLINGIESFIDYLVSVC